MSAESSHTQNPTQKNSVKVGVVQASPIILNREATLEKVSLLCKEAGCNGKGAELVLFPEAFISWYPRGSIFGVVIGSRTQEGRELYRKYWESSVNVPGPAVDRLSQIAKENKIHLVMGVIEREEGVSHTLYCSLLFFNNEGQYLGKHRKVMPTAGERLVWGCGDGSTLPVFDTEVGRIGGVICWENYMPLLRMAMYGKGIEIYLAPTADARDSWVHSMKHIAMEGRCFVLTCNQFVTKGDYPEGLGCYESEDSSFVVSRGGSCIINPYGEILAGPNYEGETILYAHLDLGQIIEAKFDFDPVGHYSRGDLFSLVVNEKHNETVSYSQGCENEN